MKRLAIPVFIILASTCVHAQSCATLTVTGSLTPGSTIDISVSGSFPNAFTLIAASDTLGSTTFALGTFGSFMVDLAQPVALAPIGFTDAAGGLSLPPIVIPATAAPLPSPIHIQTVSLQLAFPGGLVSCNSNVVTL